MAYLGSNMQPYVTVLLEFHDHFTMKLSCKKFLKPAQMGNTSFFYLQKVLWTPGHIQLQIHFIRLIGHLMESSDLI